MSGPLERMSVFINALPLEEARRVGTILVESVEEAAGEGDDYGRGVLGVRRIYWTAQPPEGKQGEEGGEIWSLCGRSPPLLLEDGGAEGRLMRIEAHERHNASACRN